MSENDITIDRRSLLKAGSAAGALAAFGGITMAAPGREPGPKSNEVLVGVSAGAGEPKEVAAKHAPAKASVAHENKTLRYAAVKFPEEASDTARQNFMDAVADDDAVKYAEENGTYETQLSPDDPKFSDQYAPQMVNAPTAWDTTKGTWDVTIAVLDTGVQYDHPELSNNYASNPGKDFVDDDSDPAPDVPSDEYHGTHVSGIAGGETDNATGIAGMSESELINGRCLDENGSGSYSDVADAITWAADQGADIINMSLGGSSPSSTIESAVDYAHSEGSLIVAAAGNSGSDAANHYPSAYSKVMSISALDSDGTIASYSNTGEEIDVCAPGSGVLSTAPTDSYKTLSGTSMATPVVSGVAGLALGEYDLTNVELRDHLKNTAVDIGLSANKQGSGRVDAANAVETAPAPCGARTNVTTITDQLSGSSDSDCWMREFEYSEPCRVTVELSGPTDADFDLYINEADGYCPSTDSYDYRGFSVNSQETIIIDNPKAYYPLYIRVDSWSGSGSYDLTITEEGL
ncbi:S8 family serine peptidase [Halorussus caseinilyticus]|uniref:S8 family serine peptidase n=1 Tax=Halorussus caseinilyticus TaxID=3034025 RepID=A0ABD5WKL0_9EURY|nr:S8 family serine peptidase [Halorussus sp. DT72]